MAFPWIFESNFEGGSNAEWDSESDTGSKLDFPHYSELARFPWKSCAPYRGAYCARIKMGDTNDHTLSEGDIDIADAATRYFRFYLNLMPDVEATADDTFNLFELQQADGTRECSLGLRITAATDAVEIGIGDGTAPSDFATNALTKNEWHCIEWIVLISTGGAGTQTLIVDGVTVVSLTTLTNAAAVAQGVFGTQDTLATTTGTILLDEFTMDDAQLYPFRQRFPEVFQVTKSGHVFVGPGNIASGAILSTGSDNIMRLWDTDLANVNETQGFKVELDNNAATSVEGPIFVKRGLYVQLTGTSPRGQVVIKMNHGDQPDAVGPLNYNEKGIRWWGLRGHKPHTNV